jgi:flagellar export protein FliJ
MKRFRFPLERVLAYRRLQMEAEQARLEQSRQRLAAADARIAQWREECERTLAAVRQALAPGADVSATALATYPNYRSAIGRAGAALASERARAAGEVAKQLAKTVEARRTHEVLAKARSQARTRWEEDVQREIEATAGELFLAQWRRRR